MESVFGSGSSIPPLHSSGCALISDTAGKTVLLSGHFDGKQPRETLVLPATCHRHDPHGGVDLLGFFPLVFN